MKYPALSEIQSSTDTIEAFYGYDHNLKISDGEFYDMENLTSSYYPILSPRDKRGTYVSGVNPKGIIAKDTLCYVDGSYFVMDQYRINMGLDTGTEKQLISMSSYVVILPDKKYINTADITDYGNIEANYTSTDTVTFDLCQMDGTEMTISYRQASEPESPSNMQYWIDTSGEQHVLKRYSTTSSMWVSIATTYVKIGSQGIGAAFNQYDGVDISGLKDVSLVDSETSAAIEDSDLANIDGSFVVWAKGDNYIVITAMLDVTRSISNHITVSRKMPLMDHVIESGNRLWGCRYGVAANGHVVNEIYASKLGDFKNWSCYMGISTDSYTASCGTDGMWTGAINHMGYPCFFKENHLHKVYGNYPSNYQIQDTECRGVQRGSSKSLAIVNENLYYKSRNGVCVYDGSLPTEISGAFGEEQYFNAVGGSHGNKYYISMQDSNSRYVMFVYDAAKGLWHKEDGTHAVQFCSCRNELYYIDGSSIRTVFGSGVQDTAKTKWMAETGIVGTEKKSRYSTSYMPGKKYVSQMQFRMSLGVGSMVRFYIEYDSSGEWQHVSSMQGRSLRSFCVPIRPKRCDHFRIRIAGEGQAKIYSVSKTIEKGSDF